MAWERATLITLSIAAASCVTVGDADDSWVIPDYSLYPPGVMDDTSKISLDSPDGYTNQSDPSDLQPYVLRRYRVGPPRLDEGKYGGLTLTVVGNGEPVCVIIDPENTRDDGCDFNDGDLDLFAGVAEDYTGVKGEGDSGLIGGFASSWTDDLGVEHVTDTNLCAPGSAELLPPARSLPEMCAFETEEGKEYTVLLRTFVAPLDDYVTNVAVLVQPGHRGSAACVVQSSGDRYYINGTAENLDESDAAFGDDPYADLRDHCYCPANEDEERECGFIE